MSELMESAWEPEERGFGHGCEVCSNGPVVATWRKRGLPAMTANIAELIAWFDAVEEPRWVCDAHKVEPQPPEYSEWLAAQEGRG